MTAVFGLAAALGVGGTLLLDRLTQAPQLAGPLATFVGKAPSTSSSDPGRRARHTLFLDVSQHLGVCAALAGQGMLHKRLCGTFTFLLFAPVHRLNLLTLWSRLPPPTG